LLSDPRRTGADHSRPFETLSPGSAEGLQGLARVSEKTIEEHLRRNFKRADEAKKSRQPNLAFAALDATDLN